MDNGQKEGGQKSNGESASSGPESSTKICSELANLMSEQRKFIQTHLSRHMAFRGYSLERINSALGNLNDEYGWVVREMYCGGYCRFGKCNCCEPYKKYIEKHGWRLDAAKKIISVGLVVQKLDEEGALPKCKHVVEFLNKFEPIITAHLPDHKWFRGISDEREGTSDLVKRFGWAARDIFCRICGENEGCQPYRDYLRGLTLSQ